MASSNLPRPGCPGFAQALIQHCLAELDKDSGTRWYFDPSLFSAILMACIVGQLPDRSCGGTIVDVLSAEQDRRSTPKKGHLRKTMAHVKGVCEGIFGLETHCVAMHDRIRPSDLGYHLLIDSPPQQEERAAASRRRTATPGLGVQIGSTDMSRPSSGLPSLADLSSAKPSSEQQAASRGNRRMRSGTFASIRSRTSARSLQSAKSADARITSNSAVTDQPMLAGALTESPGDHGSDSPGLRAEHIPDDQRNTRPPRILILSGLEGCDRPVWVAVSEMLRTGSLWMPSASSADPALEPEMDWLEYDMRDTTVIWVRDEESSESCPSWLIDHFALGITVHPDDLVAPPALPRTPIIPSDYVRSLSALLAYTHIHPPLFTHLSNLLSAVSLDPHLKTTITGRCVRLFPDLVRVHRILSGSFDLPSRWEDALARLEAATEAGYAPDKGADAAAGGISGGRWGLGGGKGGVDTWSRMAGEEPIMLKELVMFDREEEGGDDWYATVKDVEGALWPAIRHRVAWRGERREVMWLLKGNAAGAITQSDRSTARTVRPTNPGDPNIRKKAEKRARRAVDDLIQHLLSNGLDGPSAVRPLQNFRQSR